MRDVIFSVQDLSVSYAGKCVLQPVTLELRQGERLALIGESGSGKTTLAMAIAGLLPEHAHICGQIRFPLHADRPVAGRDIGVVFQDPNGSLDPVMCVGDQIAEVLVTHLRLSWSEARAQAADLMAQVQIADSRQRMKDYPHEFSGGQKQRIALAAALAAQPQLLIADEPTSALDTVVQSHVVKVLDHLVRAQDLSLLFVTHDIALASQMADRIGVLYQGKLVETGTAQQVISAPQHAYTKALLETHIGLNWQKQSRLPEIDDNTLAEAGGAL